MRFLLALLLAAAWGFGCASEQEIQKALIQRDQQSAEFAARLRGADTSRLERLHARQLLEVSTQPLQPELRPYQRQKMADERALILPPPATAVRSVEKPLPLPGRAGRVTDPIPAQGLFP